LKGVNKTRIALNAYVTKRCGVDDFKNIVKFSSVNQINWYYVFNTR